MNRFLLSFLSGPFLVCAILFTGTNRGHADLFVSQLGASKIGRYRSDGSIVNASLITNAVSPTAILVFGSNIYVASSGQAIARYNLDGSLSAGGFITGLTQPVGLATDGTSLYVSNYATGIIGKYDLATGATTNASLITGLDHPRGLLFHQDMLYVANFDDDTVKSFSPTDGAANATLVLPAGSGPVALAATATGNLLVASYNTGKVGEYTPNFATVDDSLLTTVVAPSGIVSLTGGKFAVVSAAGTVGTYTATGKAVNAALLTNLGGAFAIAATATDTPYPKPTLVVNGSKKFSTSSSQVTLKGTSENATSVKVKVGAKSAKSATGTAKWTYAAKLETGVNNITVVSKGPGGASKSVKLTITRKPAR